MCWIGSLSLVVLVSLLAVWLCTVVFTSVFYIEPVLAGDKHNIAVPWNMKEKYIALFVPESNSPDK